MPTVPSDGWSPSGAKEISPLHVGGGVQRWLFVVVVFVASITVVISIGLPLVGMRAFIASDNLFAYPPWREEAFAIQSTNPLLGDTVDVVMPMRAESWRRLMQGDLPLWTPYPSGGTPLAAVPDVGTLSPLNLPYLIFPLWYAPALSKLLEAIVAISFTFAFLRMLGLGRPAALLGGMTFAFSGFLVVWTNWPQSHVAALIAPLFWSIERTLRRSNARNASLVALVVAVMLFEGFPSVTAYALLAAGAYAISRAGLSKRQSWRALGLIGVGVTAGFALAGVQLVPFVERLQELDLGYRRQSSTDHLPLYTMGTLAAPNILGTPVERNYFGPGNYVEVQGFAGVTSLALVGIAAFRGSGSVVRRAGPYLWTAAGIMIVLLYLGGWPLALAQTIPPFNANFVGRLRSVLGFVLAALAAIGFEALVSGWKRPESWARFISLLGVASGAALAGLVGWGIWNRAVAAEQTSEVLNGLTVPLAVGFLFIGALVLRLRTNLGVAAFGLIPMLVAVEILAFARPYWPRVSLEQFYPSTATHRYLQSELGPDRLAAAGLTLYPGTTTFYGLRSVTSHSFHSPNWADLLLRLDPSAFDQSPTFSFLSPTASVATSPILDRLAARFFVTAPEHPVFGRRVEVAQSTAATFLSPGRTVRAPVPPLPVRAIVVQVVEPFKAHAVRSLLTAEIVDREGRALGLGSRRVMTEMGPGELVIPVSEPQWPEGSAGGEVWLTLSAEGADLPLGADADGFPALSIIVADEDHLRLAFAQGAVVYERIRSLPRIRWAAEAVVETSPSRRLELLSKGSLPDWAVLLSRAGPRASGAEARLNVLEDSGDELRVSVEAEGAGYLVVADAIQSGWRAWVDGEPAFLYPADHALGAVFVPEGRRVVTIRYQPDGRVVGLVLTALAGAVLVAMATAPSRCWSRVIRRGSAQSD